MLTRIALIAAALPLWLGCAPVEPSSAEQDKVFCRGDPAIAVPDEGCGVFVSSSLGSDDNPGTRALPVRTLGKALALAGTAVPRVYACAETFHEAVEIPAGGELWGGLDCGDAWMYGGAAKRTTIAPGPDAIPLRFLGGPGMSVAANLHVMADSATQPGGSSIAAMIMPDAVVEVRHSELIAGDGAAGAAGDDGGDEPAQKGADGMDGGTACTGNVVPGAPSVVTSCGGIDSVSGEGGAGFVDHGGDGAMGKPEPVPNPLGYGRGGPGGDSNGGCSNGMEGAHGAHGESGFGGVGSGKIDSFGWRGDPGEDGGDGLPGQGGGGGGGAPGGADCPGGANGGASGGSGGAGGCGGKGGKGGGYGGASVGLLTLGVDVTIRATAIVTGNGGDGGPGGTRQLGGASGLPGYTGLGATLACSGGPGGLGGDGGDGGGGLGGPSIGIAHLLSRAPALDGVTVDIGEPGKGGPGGNPLESIPGTAGEDGASAEVQGFPVP